MAYLEKLNQRVGDLSDEAKPRPLLTLEEFFEGNNDYGSIGYNLPDQPPPAEFYRVFREIRDRDEVADVRVEVFDQVSPEEWPSSDTVWIITTAAPDVVRTWLPEQIAPDDVLIGLDQGLRTTEAYDAPAGHQAVGIWWD